MVNRSLPNVNQPPLTNCKDWRYTELLSKSSADIPPRQSAAFFMPENRQHTSMVGVENSHTKPARGKLCAVSLEPRVRPTTRTKGGFSQNQVRCIMPNITIGTSEIRCIDGLYSLNDLHKASGFESRHRPNYFLENKQTKDLIKELTDAGIPASLSKRGGKEQGTYVCKELVIAYAAWISPAFHLKVIRTFLEQTGRSLPTPEIFISKAQAGELSALIAERFPDGRQRPYAWGRFNNHFRLASYKDLPSSKFAEACEYIRQIPLKKEDLLVSQLPEAYKLLFDMVSSLSKTKSLPSPKVEQSIMSDEQVAEFKKAIDSVWKMFHPLSDQFQALLGAVRILRGLDGKTGINKPGYIAVMK